ERSFSGIVAARVQSDLGFRVPGKILQRLVDVGQTVRRGQALMRIDPTDLRLAMRAHEEAVAAAKTRARQAADEEARYRHLVSAKFVSGSAYDKVKATADSARAELNAAEAQAGVARNETGYAVLLADADGVVVETLAEPGQVVGAGQIVVRVARAGLREAIIDPGEGPGVWLIEGETPRVTRRAVQISSLSGEAASVVGNLEAGDRVVALGAHLLHEGEHVRIAQTEAARSVAVNSARRR